MRIVKVIHCAPSPGGRTSEGRPGSAPRRWVPWRAPHTRRSGLCRPTIGRGDTFTLPLDQKRILRAAGASIGGIQALSGRETFSGARAGSSGRGSGGRSCLIIRATVDFGKFIVFTISFNDLSDSINPFNNINLSSYSYCFARRISASMRSKVTGSPLETRISFKMRNRSTRVPGIDRNRSS